MTADGALLQDVASAASGSAAGGGVVGVSSSAGPDDFETAATAWLGVAFAGAAFALLDATTFALALASRELARVMPVFGAIWQPIANQRCPSLD